jgi:hypothetical protein
MSILLIDDTRKKRLNESLLNMMEMLPQQSSKLFPHSCHGFVAEMTYNTTLQPTSNRVSG